MITFDGKHVKVDKELQEKKGIKKLEIELTEEGLLKSVHIERYPFACSWSDEENEEN
ncbi:hypothetical protein [Bacillus thuringiensis]|uniref:hypothetical protein n=1 Tax=Bacillus thuringiensis TaxID=1428 RepID=UPI0015969F36|nr:hypothetical protein [Bacillus thuringiensis]